MPNSGEKTPQRKLWFSQAITLYLVQRDPWYFREDPRMNSHHAHWHLVSGGTHRRREVFYYMHNQMLNRFQVDWLDLPN